MPKGYARYALAVMVGINFLNYMNRYVPTAVSPIIQKRLEGLPANWSSPVFAHTWLS